MPLELTGLRCEHRTDPAGIDVLRPRLGWVLRSEERGQRKTAYRVLVASSPEVLARDEGDLWDSGRVESSESAHVEYGGSDLRSGMRCFWKAMAWDRDGSPGPWSERAEWSMGLLSPTDWTALWIGRDAAAYDASTVWPDLSGAPQVAPAAGSEPRLFRRSIVLPADRAVRTAHFSLVGGGSYDLWINGRNVGSPRDYLVPACFDALYDLLPGPNVLGLYVPACDARARLSGRLKIEFDSGESVVIELDQSWKTHTGSARNWETPEFDDAAWPQAEVVGRLGDTPVERPHMELSPPPYLRKEFRIEKPVARAVLYASALGVYEARLNGRRVGNDLLAPGYTDYRRRVYCNAYDVTDLLAPGENALGAILGDGWYAGYLAFTRRKRWFTGGGPRFIAQLVVEHVDGSRAVVQTDGSWRASTGAILWSDMLMGCGRDSRRDIEGWDRPGFDGFSWHPVEVSENIALRPISSPAEPMRAAEELPAQSVTEPLPGRYVYDLGQNMVGWVRVKVNGASGRRVIVRHGEMLRRDGSLYTANLRTARSADVFWLRGGPETLEPIFTFHGFRYVEISGLDSPPPPEDVVGIVVHSEMRRTGRLECSNELVNKLHRNIIWGQKGNYLDVPTDCPQRDERAGWTGDAQVFIKTGCYNMDVAAFFTKWLLDLEDSQRPDGGVPDVVPDVLPRSGPSAGWGDAAVVCPWTAYQMYGDRRLLVRLYPAMRRWLDFLRRRSPGNLSPGLGAYGDWLNVDDPTPKELIATAYYGLAARIMAEAARALGNGEASEYETLFEGIREAFVRAFVDDDGRIGDDSQTGYLMALRFGLLPDHLREKAARRLVERIEARQVRLSTGFLGVSCLLPTLTDIGRTDLAYRLLASVEYPSWGYSIVNGATTIWERWNSYTEKDGFGDVGMNSFNHYAYGSAGEWMYGVMAGIEPGEPGFGRVVIRPRPGGGMSFVKARYESIRGPIEVHWRLEGKAFRLDVGLPANTSATVFVPARSEAEVTEGGVRARDAEGVEYVESRDGAAVYEVGSGRYSFDAPA